MSARDSGAHRAHGNVHLAKTTEDAFIDERRAIQGAGLSSPYVASKHGVAGLTRAAAHDYGPYGVRVNAVAPGPIRKPMTALAPEKAMAAVVARTRAGRMGEPHEVGEVVAWLCSPAASYINGAVLPIDGGGYRVT